MRLLIYTDNHFSKYSSILRTRGEKYSKRLENQIQSLNWVNQVAKEKYCDAIICLGDFFDSQTLDAEELSALKEIKWSGLSQVFLVGNHELGIYANAFNSANLFNLLYGCTVESKPHSFCIGDTLVLFLPYIVESERKPLEQYISYTKEHYNKVLVLSHNDISGIQYGGFKSNVGFPIEEINECCDLFINGHLHNGSTIGSKVVLLGNLTGQNFNEDGFNYGHRVMILETDTLKYEFIENPYAIYFYKLDFTNGIPKSVCVNDERCVLSITIKDSQVDDIKEWVSKEKSILEYRLVVKQDDTNTKDADKIETISKVDHFQEFVDLVHSKVGNSKDIDEELGEILK